MPTTTEGFHMNVLESELKPSKTLLQSSSLTMKMPMLTTTEDAAMTQLESWT